MVVVTADQSLMKEINRTLVLDAVRRFSPISRPDVGKQVGLGKGTISNLVNGLIDDEWVCETGFAQSNGGRRAAMLVFNEEAAHVVGVDISVDGIRAILANLRGKVLFREECAIAETEPEYVYSQLTKVISTLMSKAPTSRYGIAGIGVGFAGVIDDAGCIVFAPSFHWRMFKLQDRLAAEFGLPVVVDNEARVGVLGEVEFGGHEPVANMVYVSIGNGIGTGIMINNVLYRGATGFAGEAGHMADFQSGAADVELSSVRSWQSAASVSALVRRARESTALGPSATFDLVLDLAGKNDGRALALLHSAGIRIGIGVANLIHLLNPTLVVIGGEMVRARRWIEPAIDEAIRHIVPLYREQPLPIGFSALEADATVLGAAAMTCSNFLKGIRVVQV